ncbi:MAG: hypothetical protein ACYDER_10500 [Ktedonobacteraceae bacterium]
MKQTRFVLVFCLAIAASGLSWLVWGVKILPQYFEIVSVLMYIGVLFLSIQLFTTNEHSSISNTSKPGLWFWGVLAILAVFFVGGIVYRFVTHG